MNKKTNNVVEKSKKEIFERVKNLNLPPKKTDSAPEGFKCCDNCEYYKPFYFLNENGFSETNVGGCDFNMELKPCKKFKPVSSKLKPNYNIKSVLKESVVILNMLKTNLQIIMDYFDFKKD